MYPKNRDKLKKYADKSIELKGIFIGKKDTRGALFRYIKKEDVKICDHLYIKADVKGLVKYDNVKIKGTVRKYVSMSWQKPLTENYGIFDAEIKKDEL